MNGTDANHDFLDKVKLYHAIQLQDFATYLELGGVLCRQTLSEANSNYTRFFSDEKDKQDGSWNRTFGNFSDIGARFANLDGSIVPNAYGPICIVLKPGVIQNLRDFKITKISVASRDYSSLEHDIKLCKLPDYFTASGNAFYPKSEFSALEFSCSDLKIGFEYTAYIIVDEIKHNEIELFDLVFQAVQNSSLKLQVKRRKLKNPEHKLQILEKLQAWAIKLEGNLMHSNESLAKSLPNELKEWFKNLPKTGKRILASWLTYTYLGTLRHM